MYLYLFCLAKNNSNSIIFYQSTYCFKVKSKVKHQETLQKECSLKFETSDIFFCKVRFNSFKDVNKISLIMCMQYCFYPLTSHVFSLPCVFFFFILHFHCFCKIFDFIPFSLSLITVFNKM